MNAVSDQSITNMTNEQRSRLLAHNWLQSEEGWSCVHKGCTYRLVDEDLHNPPWLDVEQNGESLCDPIGDTHSIRDWTEEVEVDHGEFASVPASEVEDEAGLRWIFCQNEYIGPR